MSIKLVLLKSGETIVTEAKELVLQESEQVYGYLFTNPQKVFYDNQLFLIEKSSDDSSSSVKISLSPWILLSKDKDVLVSRDWIVTVVDPIDSLTEMYLEQVDGSNN